MLTDDIQIVSSIHGRQRRSQRDITKRDLQSAIKYGNKIKGKTSKKHGETWIYEFAEVVYVTDYTSTIEITSWAVELPISEVIISEELEDSIKEAKRRIVDNPAIITSHTGGLLDEKYLITNSYKM